MAVSHHGGNGGPPGRAAVSPVIDGEKVDPDAIVNRAHIIIIGYDFTVSMKKEDRGRLLFVHVKPGAYDDIVLDRDQHIPTLGSGPRTTPFRPGMEQEHEDLGPVQERIVNF
jgi:hypothetical protein